MDPVFNTACLGFDGSKLMSKKTNKIIQALVRMLVYTQVIQRIILMNAYILSPFGYCTVVWMNRSRILNNTINELHKREFRLAYSDQSTDFSDIVIKDKPVTIIRKN